MAGHELRVKQLQDRAVQETTAAVPAGLRLSAVSQQQGQTAQPTEI